MKYDIETLREFIAGASPFVQHTEALDALNRLSKERAGGDIARFTIAKLKAARND